MPGDLNQIIALATTYLCRNLPAHKCCNDDAPRCAATICVGLLQIFVPPAAEPNGIEKQEQEVQRQTCKRHASQQKDRLIERREKLWKLNSHYCTRVNNSGDNGLPKGPTEINCTVYFKN